MTDDPRYAPPQHPGSPVGRPPAQGYGQAGYQQSYDWRYAAAPQYDRSYDPRATSAVTPAPDVQPNRATGPASIVGPSKALASSTISLIEAGLPRRYLPGTTAPPTRTRRSHAPFGSRNPPAWPLLGPLPLDLPLARTWSMVR